MIVLTPSPAIALSASASLACRLPGMPGMPRRPVIEKLKKRVQILTAAAEEDSERVQLVGKLRGCWPRRSQQLKRWIFPLLSRHG
jgi:hypothetical protein